MQADCLEASQDYLLPKEKPSTTPSPINEPPITEDEPRGVDQKAKKLKLTMADFINILINGTRI